MKLKNYPWLNKGKSKNMKNQLCLKAVFQFLSRF
jgi:hypothetical protein